MTQGGPAGCPSFGTEGNGESLGQLGGASLSNCRELRVEGVEAKPGCKLSENPTSCQNGIVSQRNNTDEAAWRGFVAVI
jgi:hypothetical protein